MKTSTLVLLVILSPFILSFVVGKARYLWAMVNGRKIERKPRSVITAYFRAVMAGGMLVFAIVFADYDPARFIGKAPMGTVVNPLGTLLLVMMIFGMLVFIAGALIVRFTQAKRGYVDIGVGAVGGIVFTFAMQMISGEHAVDIHWSFRTVKNWAGFVLGGALAGFTYWHARGFPGLARSNLHRAEAARRAIEFVQDTGDRPVEVGVVAARHLRRTLRRN